MMPWLSGNEKPGLEPMTPQSSAPLDFTASSVLDGCEGVCAAVGSENAANVNISAPQTLPLPGNMFTSHAAPRGGPYIAPSSHPSREGAAAGTCSSELYDSKTVFDINEALILSTKRGTRQVSAFPAKTGHGF
jgi:hypothetical protein